ncbi:hypothetical protein B566_EDAN015586 [Ephemera danica]|nr:hypothetical protein B566_EDAN015586 [Ephemera danica]
MLASRTQFPSLYLACATSVGEPLATDVSGVWASIQDGWVAEPVATLIVFLIFYFKNNMGLQDRKIFDCNAKRQAFKLGFEPNTTMNTAHHMLLFGCKTPGSQAPVWNCGEMSKAPTPDLKSASPCGSGTQIIYAWALDAPRLSLPDDVGFRVGGDSPIQYIVLQVHYHLMDSSKIGQPDTSGIFLHYTERPLNKLAGVYLLGTGGVIAPQSTEHMETSCYIKEKKVIHPFAYRTHTHKLDFNGTNHWTLLGKRNPNTPQMFYPVENPVPIGYGDMLAARCTMMCNFYLMYYVDNDTPLETKYCFTSGPPEYYWNQVGLNNIPERSASEL